MKEEFYGFYEPTDEELNSSWATGTFVFDTNSLLNLYRYSDATRNDFLVALDTLKDRIFMPHQVGLEYHSNRIDVIETSTSSYSTLLEGLKGLVEKEFKPHLNQFKRHPAIEIGTINNLLEDFIAKVAIQLDKQKRNHPDFSASDDVLNKLSALYKDKVGKAFSKEELNKLYLEGKARYDQQIPPGYKDLEGKKKKGDRYIYGDFIIWKEIIGYALSDKKNIVLVTDDRKEDWWTIRNGKTVRPREELVKEFFDLTQTRILIYNTENFLHFAKERKLVTKIKKTSIDEVKQVRQFDETNDTITNLIAQSNHVQSLNRDVRFQALDTIAKTIAANNHGIFTMKDFAEASRLAGVQATLRDIADKVRLGSSEFYNDQDRELNNLIVPIEPIENLNKGGDESKNNI